MSDVTEAPEGESVETHEGVLVPRQKHVLQKRKEQEELLGGIKNKIFGDSMKVIEDFLRARDIDPSVDKERDPAYWQMQTELGDEEETKKAYRLATAGWLPGSETPGFVKVATQMAVGIMKANAAEKGGSKTLHVGKVIIDASLIPVFDEKEVDG